MPAIQVIVRTPEEEKAIMIELLKMFNESLKADIPPAPVVDTPPEPLLSMLQVMSTLQWGRQKLRNYRKKYLIKPAKVIGNNKYFTLSQFIDIPLPSACK